MRRNVGGYEENAGKIAALARSTGQREVPAMDGVECTAEKTNIHEPLVSRFAGSVGKSSASSHCYVYLKLARAWPIVDSNHCPVGPKPDAEKTSSQRIWNELL